MALSVGRHFLAELVGCDADLISRVETVMPVLERAVRASGATPLRRSFHQFEPAGVTALILIAESHVSIHTWPEHAYAAVDFFTCSREMDAARAIRVLAEGLGAERTVTSVVARGIPE